MNAFTSLPNQFPWSAQQLADAVPRRLSELSLFEGVDAGAARSRRAARRSFLPAAQPALFRVRG